MTPSRPETDGVSVPDFDQLREIGWTVGTIVGRYCVAWRGADEAVFLWDGGRWRFLGNRSAVRSAA